ncbi:uncharacterized protein EI90DRAFT_3053969, partial [Cantharellus anzutake]|uniref:uncharacterized protein n=1 Tax=Cantharellus anzutake TaxID=1750568 RepID=UPI001903197C
MFVLCIQIYTPVGPQFPQHPSAFYVPRDLLQGIEDSLDNSHTGDVRFVCIERLPNERPSNSDTRSSDTATSFAYRPQQVRKRVIFAHSDLLKRRTEYFNTMLSSRFAEGYHPSAPSERRVHDVVLEEADFVTIYWLLKWVYANWLLFKEVDDPRDAVNAMGAGWSANWLNLEAENEWEVTTLIASSPTTGDNSSVASTEAGVDMRRSPGRSPAVPSPSSQTGRVSRPSPGGTWASSNSSPVSAVSSRRAGPTTSPPARSHEGASASAGAPHTSGTRTSSSAASPRSARVKRSSPPTNDPHPHPTPAPPPASALSIYLVAHRYGIKPLASLAVEHTMNTVTPQTAFPLLLATQFFSELRGLLEDYIVDHWDQVSRSEEFDVCCQEIAAGEWAAFEGGATLSALFRRLHRPTSS